MKKNTFICTVCMFLLAAVPFETVAVADDAISAITILAQGSIARGNSLYNTTPRGCWYLPDADNSGSISGPGIPEGTELLVIIVGSTGTANAVSVSYRANSVSDTQYLTRVQTVQRTVGDEIVSIWYVKSPIPGNIDGTQDGAMFIIQSTTSQPTPTNFYRFAAYLALSGVDPDSPIFSFTNEEDPASPASIVQTVEQLPLGHLFIAGAACRAYSDGPVPFPVPAYSGLNPVTSQAEHLGTDLATSISARMDAFTPIDGTTSRSVSYANKDNSIGTCSVVIRPMADQTTV